MKTRALAHNAAWSLASHLLNRGSLMLGGVVLARNLKPEAFAAYSYFQMTVAMLATFAALGLGVTASRFFAEVDPSADRSPSPVGTLLVLSLSMSVIAFMGTLCLPKAWLETGLDVPRWMLAIGVSLSVAAIVPSGGILGLEKYKAATLISALSAICLLGLIAISAQVQEPRIGMWAIVAGLAVQTAGQIYIIVRFIGAKYLLATASGGQIRRHAPKVLRFAGPMFFVSVIAGSSTWIVGRLVLGDSGEQEFALYSIGLQWLALGLLIPGIVSRVTLPRLVRSAAQDSKQLVEIGVIMAIVPALALLVLGCLLAPRLISLYGPNYDSSYWVIPIFLLIALLNAPVNTLGNAIVARSGQLNWLVFNAVAVGFLVILLLAVPERSVFWAAIAHCVSAILMLLQSFIYGKQKGLV